MCVDFAFTVALTFRQANSIAFSYVTLQTHPIVNVIIEKVVDLHMICKTIVNRSNWAGPGQVGNAGLKLRVSVNIFAARGAAS